MNRTLNADDSKQCLQCGRTLSAEQQRDKFCSKSCAASHNNLGVTRHSKHANVCECANPKKRHNKWCADCIEKRVYNRPSVFDGLKSPKRLRSFLIRERGHRCEDCGLETWKGLPIPLELHHKDGDADNNVKENLMLLCPNCHAFTPHHKGAVKGKDSARQVRRRRRYAEGKTY